MNAATLFSFAFTHGASAMGLSSILILTHYSHGTNIGCVAKQKKTISNILLTIRSGEQKILFLCLNRWENKVISSHFRREIAWALKLVRGKFVCLLLRDRFISSSSCLALLPCLLFCNSLIKSFEVLSTTGPE